MELHERIEKLAERIKGRSLSRPVDEDLQELIEIIKEVAAKIEVAN